MCNRLFVFYDFCAAGDFAQAHAKFRCNLPLRHFSIELLHQLPAKGEIMAFRLREYFIKELFHRCKIINGLKHFDDLVDVAGGLFDVSIHRNNIVSGKGKGKKNFKWSEFSSQYSEWEKILNRQLNMHI